MKRTMRALLILVTMAAVLAGMIGILTMLGCDDGGLGAPSVNDGTQAVDSGGLSATAIYPAPVAAPSIVIPAENGCGVGFEGLVLQEAVIDGINCCFPATTTTQIPTCNQLLGYLGDLLPVYLAATGHAPCH